jgi:tRNA pseudouridine38-40 synthase
VRSFDVGRTQILIRFGYDGARFKGLQPQAPGIPTAGQALRERLCEAAGSPPKGLAFAARTDAGVHALKNLATCYFRDAPDPQALLARLEAPRDDGLVAVRAFLVPPTVHARGSGRGKRYRYLVEDGADDADQPHAYVWAIAPRLDAERMRRAALHFVGTHDFTTLRGGGCSAASATKTIARLRVGGPFDAGGGRRRFVIEVTGDAFLRKMVRNLVGLLVEIGAGLREPDDVPAALAARDHRARGLCAPAAGLCLVEVGCSWPEDGSALIRM